MARVSTEHLRSQIEQADAAFRDLFDEVSTEEIQTSLQSFSKVAAKCPATAIFATISDFGPMSAKVIAAAIGRSVAQVLLNRWELEGNTDGT